MSGRTEDNVSRKRPPELSLSGPRWVGATTSTAMATQNSRQRREVSTASVTQSPDHKKVVVGKVSSRRLRKKDQALPLLSRLRSRLEASSIAANVALEVQLRRHGRYISRHSVRTLLLACLIITSLFYPAAGIYLWASKGGPGVTRGDARSVWRSLSTPFLDSFASSGRKHHNSLRDLRMVWDDAPDLRAVDARDADAYLGSITPLNLFPHSWPAEQDDEQEKKCRSVRVEHVFVTTDDVMMGLGARFGALDVPILQSALSLQETIESHLMGDQSGLRCVQASQSPDCLTLSPLSFWHQNSKQLAVDPYPTSTLLGSSLNITSQGIPLSLTTTLAGRSHLFSKLPRADHLAITFFLEDEEDCHQQINKQSEEILSKGHEAWLSMLRNITGGQVGILSSEINSTKEVVLQFVPVHSSTTFITQRLLLASGYIAVFIWLTRSLMKIQNVHSRFGLAFTGVVELIISMTLAISICALCGVRLTLVPWEILPFVVVVIGSENMFVLTNAIISTPISLSVSTRVAMGLEKVGVPIAVTVLSDVVLMTVIMMLVDVRAVREFCIFAIFSLIVDFFMQMTLYSTVLSIDLQRLELADLLSQGGPKESNTLLTNNSNGDNESNASEPSASADGLEESYSQRNMGENRRKPHVGGGAALLKMSCRTMWRARTARTASLSLLLAFMFGIYLYHGSGYPSHHSYPFLDKSNTTIPIMTAVTSTQANLSETPRFDPFSHLTRNDSIDVIALPWWHTSPSAQFWQALNPEDAASVRIKVEPWTVLSLRSTKTYEGTQRSVAHFASWAIFRPRVRAIIWFSKLVLLPICGTTGLLWVLLLYLLKDTELLEAQQNKLDGMGGGEDEDEELVEPMQEERKSEFETSVRISNAKHTSDIDLVRQSGGFVVSLATDSSLSVWKPSKRGKSRTIVLSAITKNHSRVTAMEVDAELDLIALGHASGSVSLWTLSTLQPIEITKAPQPKQQQQQQDQQQQQRASQDSDHNETATPSTRIQSLIILPSAIERIGIVSIHRDGSIWRWIRGSQQAPRLLLAPQLGALWMSFSPLSSHGPCHNIVALSSSNYRFQLYRLSNDAPYLTCLLASQDSTSVVRCATMTTLVFGDEERSRGNIWSSVVVGTSQGSVLVYDLMRNENIGQYDILDGPVTLIRTVDYTSACPSLSYVGNRDVLIANSNTRATIMALSTITDTSPVLGASKSPVISPHKKKNGHIAANTGTTDTSFSPISNSTESKSGMAGVSPKDSGIHSNGFTNNGPNGMLLDPPITPLPLPVSNGSRHRRLSSQGRRAAMGEDISFSGEPPLPTASTIGSTKSSILGYHFDVDPFDLHNTSLLQWSRLTSIDCIRGGADIVMGNDGAKVFGVRKRAKQGSNLANLLDARWEAFQVDIDILFSDRRPHPLLELSCVKQSRLELEESLHYDSGESSGISPSLPIRSVHFVTPSSRANPQPLSFTRLDRVQAFYKDGKNGRVRGGGGGGIIGSNVNLREEVEEEEEKEAKKKKKRTIIFTFANSLAAVICSE